MATNIVSGAVISIVIESCLFSSRSEDLTIVISLKSRNYYSEHTPLCNPFIHLPDDSGGYLEVSADQNMKGTAAGARCVMDTLPKI
jgi:hypothetical protein